jgi:hypothetical protein
MKSLFYIFTVLLLTSSSSFAQLSNPQQLKLSEQTESDFLLDDTAEERSEVDNFSPFLSVVTILVFVFILVFVGAGIIITVIGLLILFGLIGTGILSASLLIGLNTRSFLKGFKTFLISSTSIIGIYLGLMTFWILSSLLHWWSIETTLLYGAITGLIGGLILGLILSIIIHRLTTYFKTQLKAK